MSSSGEQKQKAAAAAKYQPGSHTSEGGLYLIGCDLPELMARKKKKNDGSRIGYSRLFSPQSLLTCYYYIFFCLFFPPSFQVLSSSMSLSDLGRCLVYIVLHLEASDSSVHE
jgi:hypothetical protein